MSRAQWTAVDRYIGELFHPEDDALDAAIRASDAAGLPSIQVTPPQGKLLHLLARIQRARTILEIGTLGGYSTIWLARALPPGGRRFNELLAAEPRVAATVIQTVGRKGYDGFAIALVGEAG
jgi:predicted O-methyltransferase YrrM